MTLVGAVIKVIISVLFWVVVSSKLGVAGINENKFGWISLYTYWTNSDERALP